MGPLASRTYEGKELTKIRGPPAGRAKVALDYTHRPKGGFVFGALEPASGAVFTEMVPRRIGGHYTEFLGKVEQWVPPEVKHIYAIIDNLYMHSSYDVLLFSLAHPRWEFVFQPKYARLPTIPASQGTGPDSPSGDHLGVSQPHRALVEDVTLFSSQRQALRGLDRDG